MIHTISKKKNFSERGGEGLKKDLVFKLAGCTQNILKTRLTLKGSGCNVALFSRRVEA